MRTLTGPTDRVVVVGAGLDGYEFDTGPTVLTMPELIAEALASVGEELADWLDLTRLDPAYRAWFPDVGVPMVLISGKLAAARVTGV